MSGDVLSNAIRLRQKLRADLARVEEFISAYEAFALGSVDGAATAMRKKHGRPDRVSAAVEEFLRNKDGAADAGEILEHLQNAGVEMSPLKPRCDLTVILWRRRDRFVKHGRLYSLREREVA